MKILLEPIFISILTGLFILFTPKRFRKFIGFFSVLVSGYLFYLSIKIFSAPFTNINFLYVDGLSRYISLAIGFFAFLIMLYSFRFMEKYEEISSYYGYMILSEGFAFLAVLANNAVLLLIAWGFLGFTLYMLINISGPKAGAISKKTIIIITLTDGLMIIGFGIVWLITHSLNLNAMKVPINTPLNFLAFILITIGALGKAGAMPFHTWIPEAAAQAPVPVTAFLPASIDKLLGIYLLIRVVVNIFILNSFSYSLLMVIGAVIIILAGMMLLMQNDIKKLLSYSSISQVGYMIIGLGVGNSIGMAGAAFHVLNHSIYKSCLFLSAGNVEYKTKTSELDKLGGLAKIMPVTFIVSLVAALSVSGIPPFNGFFSKWMIYQGLIEKGRSGGVLWLFCLIAAMFGSGLTLASYIKFIHGTFLGSERKGPLNDVSWQMWAPGVVMALLCIIFGIFAYQIPLPGIIFPALPCDMSNMGSWRALKSAMFLFIGLGIGMFIYILGNLKGARESDTYIGGEKIEEGMSNTGAEFYNTVRETGFLGAIYKKAEAGYFDIYEQFKNIVFGFGRFFRYLHNGVLPTYLVWALLGMIGLFLFFLR
jgi:formate hydrogenlyase subunit 3/multisubunit Na+/H+ antiporter MnhD subunit